MGSGHPDAVVRSATRPAGVREFADRYFYFAASLFIAAIVVWGFSHNQGEHRLIGHVPDTVREFACPTDCAMRGEYLLPPLSKVRAVCGSTACTDLRGGRRVIGVPTANLIKNLDVPEATSRESPPVFQRPG